MALIRSVIRNLTAGLRGLFRRRETDEELDSELRQYLDAAVTEKIKAGVSREDALRAARIEMGSAEAVKEDVRAVGWETVVETLWYDIRFAVRTLRKNPGLTAIVIATLALGIGANTAIFSVVNTVLLQPMPYKQADRLVTVWGENKAKGYDLDLVSSLDYADWKSQNRVFESMGASTDEMFTLTGAGEPAAVIGYEFSPDFFDLLGISPLLGRTVARDEDQPGKDRVVVLNYHLWKTQFGGDQGVVGRSVTLDGKAYTVIGVMPASFQYPQSVELWTPLTTNLDYAKDRGIRWLRVMARLKPGVTMDRAQAEMKTIASRLRSEYPKTNKDYDVNLVTLRQLTSGDVRPALLVLLCSVGLVLLIACANVANLLLSRAVTRRREIAVRAALGASRLRMIRQFLTESVLLSLVGGALGLVIAYWGVGALVAMFPTTISNLSIPRVDTIPIDRWVLGFALLASVLTGVVFGLVPALQACRVSPNESLKESGRSGTAGAQGRRLRNILVVSEVALSLVLLTVASLMIKSFLHLVQADLGFHSDHVLTLRVLLPKYKYAKDTQQLAFSNEVLSRIQSLPGVKAAGTVTFLPLSGWWGTREVSVAGRPADPAVKNPRPVWSSVSTDYFRAANISLLKGREFTDQDNASNANVAILSVGLAHALWPDDDPIGKQVAIQGLDKTRQVIGVVGDVRQLGMVHQMGVNSEVTSEVYVPFAQVPTPLLGFAIRTAGDPLSIAKAVQRAIWEVDKEQPTSFVETMDQLASETTALQRASMTLLGVFAGLALVLASIGIYGVISYSASQRTHEIGIRIALGASSGDVLRLVIGEGLRLTVIGVAIGIAGAFGLTRFLASQLYGVSSADPATFLTVPLLLTAVAVAACYIPARRAMRVDPMVALRYE
jgi:predicted permease